MQIFPSYCKKTLKYSRTMWLQFLKTRLKLEHRKLQRQMISRSLSALSCEVWIKITSRRGAKFKIDFKKTSIGHGDRFLQLIFSCLKVNRVCLVMPENAKITLVLQGSIGPSAWLLHETNENMEVAIWFQTWISTNRLSVGVELLKRGLK